MVKRHHEIMRTVEISRINYKSNTYSPSAIDMYYVPFFKSSIFFQPIFSAINRNPFIGMANQSCVKQY